MRLWLVVLACASFLSAQDRTWAFQPAKDAFSPEALLDLRYLNEEVAGQSGFVRANSQGDFVDGTGAIIRFWGINSTVGREQPYLVRPLWRPDEPSLAIHAKFLAKRGVNLVRLNANLNPDARPAARAALNDINLKERDWIWRAVAAFKKEGIYTMISPYSAEQMRISDRWGIPGGEQDAHGLLFVDERLQAAYRNWLRALYDPVNPHTGVRLADDPAVAIIQLQHDDSLLDWPVDRLRGAQRANLGRKFYQWVVARYGTWTRAIETWQGDRKPGDNPAAGVLDFHEIYALTFEEPGGYGRRLSDQARFWAETMRNFNAATVKYLREELRCRQLINAGNGKTADAAHLEDLERYTYTAGDVLAANRYFSDVHYGRNANWAVVEDDHFVSVSALKNPLRFPLNLRQVRGYPMLLTETLWMPPMAYAAESTFLAAVYQSLTGIDGVFWASTGDDEFSPPQSANGYLASQMKRNLGGPDVLGMFPAAAFLFRKGYLQKGESVLVEPRALDDLYDRKLPLIAEGEDEGLKTGLDRLAFLAGPVETVPGGRPSDSRVTSLRPLVEGPRVRSVTGQVAFDREKGYCTIDSPRAQGVAAFFGAQSEFRFRDVTIEGRHEYGAVFVVSIDELPLRESGRVLVQVGTKARPDGWRDEPWNIEFDGRVIAGTTVTRIGKAPWRVATAELTVEIRNAGLRRARMLDANGYAIGEVELTSVAGGVRFPYPEGTLYVVLE